MLGHAFRADAGGHQHLSGGLAVVAANSVLVVAVLCFRDRGRFLLHSSRTKSAVATAVMVDPISPSVGAGADDSGVCIARGRFPATLGA